MKGVVDASSYRGELYGLQPVTNTVGLFYNEDILDQARVKPLTTWDELRTAAGQLTSGKHYGIAFAAPANYEGTWQFLPFMWSTAATEEHRDAAGLLAASTICLHVGKRVRQLTEDDFAAVLAQLDGSAALSASARHHARTRLFGLQQACYQLGSLTTPPRHSGPVAVGPLVHAAGVRQPLIRTEVVRYVQTITTTLRPYTVAGRTKALRVFFDYLADHHPEVTQLEAIERTRHIEPYLAWARTRPWRGKNRERRTIGVVAFHQDVVDLRCFFEDIAGWGWPSAPSRRLLFYPDIPRTPDALPRALTPDVDRALTTAIANLDALSCVPACCCYAPPACASANCSTWSWTACWTSPATAPGCECRSAS